MKTKKRKSFIQWLLAIFALVFLGAVATFNIVSFAHAATVTGLTDTGIGLETSGDTSNASCTASGTTITLSVTGESGTCSNTAHTCTLTIKNNKGGAGTLSFSYSLSLNGGSASIGGNSVTSNSTYSGSISNGGTLAVKVTSAEDAKTTTITITNILLSVDISATTTFGPDPNGGSTRGTYTVTCTDGNFSVTITDSSQSHTVSSLYTYALVPTAKSGYAFDCWHIGSNVNSTQNLSGLSFTSATTIYPVFKPSTAAAYQVGSDVNARYFDLVQAISAASSAKKISVVGNGTVPAGTYTIPSGYTLLVPFDNDLTSYTTTPAVLYGSHTTPSAFKTLTLADGANLVINGSLCVSGKLSATGTGSTSWNGAPTGPSGRICMRNGSSITIKSGGGLYCYGYIYGYKVNSTTIEDGTVTAESGSTIYEAMQFRCWRGGSATSGMTSGVFPMNQYYVQNIECSLVMKAGATEKVYTSVNANSSAYPTNATFISNSGSAMFVISSGSITKRYDPITDYLIIDVNGTVAVSSLSLSLSVVTINTTSYNALPITNNISINVRNGGTVNINHNLAFLPGSELNIDEGGTVNIGSNYKVYVYDMDVWTTFDGDNKVNGQYFAAPSCNIVVVGYSCNNGTNAIRKDTSGITKAACTTKDAQFDVNGTLNVSGYLYTSTGGANIISSNGTGTVVLARALSSASIQEATQSGTSITKVTISCTAPKLKNGSNYTGGEFTDATSAKTYYYNKRSNDAGYWGDQDTQDIEYTINYYAADGTTLLRTDTPTQHTSYTIPNASIAPQLNGYSIKKWVNMDNEEDEYALGQSFTDLDLGTIETWNFKAFYGGWSSDGRYYYSFDTGQKVTGLYTITYILNNAAYDEPIQNLHIYVGDTCYFKSNGEFDATTKVFQYTDSKYYYIETGVVAKDKGLVYLDTDGDYHEDSFYYIDPNGNAYTSQVRYLVDKLNGLLPAGHYEFAANGKIIIPGTPHHITSDVVKDESNNTIYSYGLFALTINNQTHLYYGKDDGTIVKNCTFYVKKTNDYFINGISSSAILIEEGVYYFDNNGYMWYGNNLLDGTSAEFGVIVSGNGVIIGRNN